MVIDISQYLEEHAEIKVISVDVFDTLLFRTAYDPADVFGKMHEFNPNAFPKNVLVEEWINVRKTAEITARKKRQDRNFEVTLEDIYGELPTIFENREKLMDVEIETEKQCCYLNDPLYEEIKKAARDGRYQIVLCSDMYLSGAAILSILEYNGFDRKLVNHAFVSCEYGDSKRLGGLFRHLLNGCEVRPEEVLHIGDGYYQDVGVAKNMGLHVLHYDLISDACYHHPFLKLEEISHNSRYQTPCYELFSMRLQAANDFYKRGYQKENEKFWFEMGAMVYGPFLACAMEWVLDQAQKQGIKTIRPFMREGDFFCKMLHRAMQYRDMECSIEPLYISRFAIFTSLFEQITEKDVEYLISTYNIYVKDVFGILKIENLANEFEQFAQEQVSNLRNMLFHDGNAYDALLEYLSNPGMLKEIRKRSKGSSRLMLDYLQEKGLFEPCMTLDLGWRGSMQKALDDIMKSQKISNHMNHLLCICSPAAAVNSVDGCRIQGYMGTFGGRQKIFSQLSARLFEMALLSREGTTVGYEKSGDSSKPVIKSIPYPESQVRAMNCIQEGILSFQSIYLKMVKKKPHLKVLEKSPEKLCGLIGRLHAYPSYKEAKMLSCLVYDQNFGANTLTPILDENMINNYRKGSFEEYYEKYQNVGISWYSGLNALGNNRLFYAERHLQMDRKFTMLSMACLANNIIRGQKGMQVVLVQAGNMTKIVLSFLAMADKKEIVAGIVDNDPKAVGAFIGGVRIYPVEHSFENPLYVFTTVREDYYRSISKQLYDIFGPKICVMGRY